MQYKSDIIIVGAGLTGITMACSLAKNDISVTVIEAADLKQIKSKQSDGRTCAISYGSSQIFDSIDLWQNLKKHAGPILDIRVTDDESPLFLHYDHKIVGKEPMGYIIENYHIRQCLFQQAAKLKNLKIIDKVKYTSITRDSYKANIKLDNNDEITASMIIAADGRNSKIRQESGIKTNSWSYNQHGIVCTVKHEQPHQGVAIEKFLPAGPFAILPMHDQHHSSLVWTEPSNLAPIYMQMPDTEFTEQLSNRFCGYLGKLEVIGKRFSYPLSLTLAQKYTSQRLALIGDAAHAMHPIAGQGFNLGIRDIPVLTELITNAKNLGLDIGGDNILNEYEKRRKFDNISLLAITDLLNRLFSNNITTIKHARRIGMAAVNKLPGLKKFFVKHAMGSGEYG